MVWPFLLFVSILLLLHWQIHTNIYQQSDEDLWCRSMDEAVREKPICYQLIRTLWCSKRELTWCHKHDSLLLPLLLLPLSSSLCCQDRFPKKSSVPEAKMKRIQSLAWCVCQKTFLAFRFISWWAGSRLMCVAFPLASLVDMQGLCPAHQIDK